MPYIQLPEGVPGIRSLVMYRPETGKLLYDLAQALVRDESPLSPAERELIAAYVSSRNACRFCMSSHAAAAYAHPEKLGSGHCRGKTGQSLRLAKTGGSPGGARPTGWVADPGGRNKPTAFRTTLSTGK
jgi:AhpD family alkylhydroperoxidase